MLAGVFTVPWALVFAAAILFTAFFTWYAEAVFIGLIFALIADIAWWKMLLTLGSVLLILEWLKRFINFEKKFYALLWLWIAGFLMFTAVFFIII